nr:hypothetical protein [Cecembia calidifontis]
MKAIHNRVRLVVDGKQAVISLGRYHFESNSQLITGTYKEEYGCDFLRKIPF